MPIDSDVGGPCLEDRQLVYAHMGMSSRAARHTEDMVHGSPSRAVGKGALTNVVTRLDSLKNGKPRVLESHTCELVFAYELELDPDVIGYYNQVPCRGVQRVREDQRRHVTSANLDFLVFRRRSVELVECKQESWLLRESAKPHSDWMRREDGWQHRPYHDFAREHDLGFMVWSPPHEPGIYLQNLEAIYGAMRCGAGCIPPKTVDRAIAAIARQPVSMSQLCEEIDGFSTRVALWMLGRWLAFGPLKSTPILMTDRFCLYSDRQHAGMADRLVSAEASRVYGQPVLADPLLLASTTDVRKARERLARLEAIERGEAPKTERMSQLANKVEAAVAEGRSPLAACLTNYQNSGNRLSRLNTEQLQARETSITREWNTGRTKRPKNLYFIFERECATLGVSPCGKTSFYKRLRQENPMRHALMTGGLRAYQAIRPATDPRMRSMPPIGYGHTLHVDSSDLDSRIAEDLQKLMPAGKAKFYIGVDGATGMPMAHALIFGPARTDGVAILLREYVRRHGCLPQLIHFDRGPENRSRWAESVAEGHASVRLSPTAGSAWNGCAENMIKQVNFQVAHQLLGSTELDQMGRKIDGRFKSRRNAKTSFDVVHEQFLRFVYKDLPNIPGADGRSPFEVKEEVLVALGDFGVPCALDEDFLLWTSIPVETRRRINAKRGIRTEEGWFTSDELITELRFHRVEELRSDCEDPTILRVRVGGRWLKAFHSRVQSMALVSPFDKLFGLMYAPALRAQSRERANNIARERHGRIDYANYATRSEHKSDSDARKQVEKDEPAMREAAQPTSSSALDPRRILWDSLDLYREDGGRE